MYLTLNSPIKDINKVAEKLAPRFKKLGLETVQDLLFYFPYRYDDYSNLIKIENLEHGVLTTVRVKIELLNSRRSFRKRMLLTESMVADETGQVKVVWFNQRYVIKMLQAGDEIYLSGKPVLTETGIEFHNPNFEKVTHNYSQENNTHTNRLVPIYSSTEKLTQKQIRFILKKVLPLANQINDWLPADIIKNEKLFSLTQAIHQIHFPVSKQNLEQARQRLKFDEIFLLQMRAGLIKKELLRSKSQLIKFKKQATKKFIASLPYELTLSQKKSAWEIIQDMEKETPMNRLLEGDVGSGKTISACLPVLNALLNKTQVAYMAPTEILAGQQFNVMRKTFRDYDFKIGLLTRAQIKLDNQELKKSELIKKIKQHDVDLVIGTHSLIQDKVEFKKLSLVIVDEQHRFGVNQRKALKNKSGQNTMPHFLSMTATPIPRSLALTVYGELELSVIDEMPSQRKPIITQVVDVDKRADTYAFVKQQIQTGRQVFIVCPLIDPSDKLGAKAVKEEFEKIDKKIFPNIKIGLLHGRLKSADKEKIMQDFADDKTKILVSTPVIEVGIDIPNASVLIIESAERFGLAQLHQLRGRVGRGEHQSYCFLFTESDSETTIKRLRAVVESRNGFELAEKDLDFRGPGEVYGIRQSGYQDLLKIAKLTDWVIIKKTKPWVDKILDIDPELKKYETIKQRLFDLEVQIHFE